MDKRNLTIEMVPFNPNYLVPKRGTYLLRVIEIGEIGRHPFNYVEAHCETMYNYHFNKFQTKHSLGKDVVVTHISTQPLN